MGARIQEEVAASVSAQPTLEAAAATPETVSVAEELGLLIFAVEPTLEISGIADEILVTEGTPEGSMSWAVTVSDHVHVADAEISLMFAARVLSVSDSVEISEAVEMLLIPAVVSFEMELPILEMELEGLWGGATAAELEAPLYNMSLVGLTGEIGAIAGDFLLPSFLDSFDGVSGGVGAISLTYPAEWVDLAITGMVDQITGTINLTWPRLDLGMTGAASAAAPALINSVVYAMNTKVLGVTQYASLGITSLCVCNGKLYGIGKDGIYEFTGRHENGFPIHTFIEKRGIDFGTTKQKRITDSYALVQSTGPYSVRVTSSGKTGTVTCPQAIGELHGSKVNLPRGIEGRMFDWAFFTDTGNEFELTEQELLIEVSATRHGRQNR